MRWLTLSAAVILAAFCHSAQAANTIDPHNVGATDVIGVITPTNPQPDPLLVLIVGNTGNGELLVDDGSRATQLGRIGVQPGSVGVVTINGSGSSLGMSWPSAVDNGGDGTLVITNGGVVENEGEFLSIGTESGGTGILMVDGTGSTLSTRRYVDVRSNGTVTVSNGGTISTERGYETSGSTTVREHLRHFLLSD